MLAAIGRSRLIELSRVGRGLDGRILAKLELTMGEPEPPT